MTPDDYIHGFIMFGFGVFLIGLFLYIFGQAAVQALTEAGLTRCEVCGSKDSLPLFVTKDWDSIKRVVPREDWNKNLCWPCRVRFLKDALDANPDSEQNLK